MHILFLHVYYRELLLNERCRTWPLVEIKYMFIAFAISSLFHTLKHFLTRNCTLIFTKLVCNLLSSCMYVLFWGHCIEMNRCVVDSE